MVYTPIKLIIETIDFTSIRKKKKICSIYMIIYKNTFYLCMDEETYNDLVNCICEIDVRANIISNFKLIMRMIVIMIICLVVLLNHSYIIINHHIHHLYTISTSTSYTSYFVFKLSSLFSFNINMIINKYIILHMSVILY